jgi:plastocyanin
VKTSALALSAALLAACSQPSAPSGSAAAPAAAAAAPAKQGTIEGTVHFSGHEPPPLQVAVAADLTSVCGEVLEQRRAQVGPNGGLGEVVVWVAGAQGPLSAAPAPPVLDQKGCVYRPRVVAAAQGTELTVTNSDPLLHNVRTASGSPRPFNSAMPITGMKVQMPLPPSPGVTRLTCDVHPWMVAFVRTFDQPYFAVTDEAGRFTIKGAPAGKATLKLWHPFLGERHLEVDVPENGVARPQVDWPAPVKP